MDAKLPEVFLGLAAPMGVGGGSVGKSLRAALRDFRYRAEEIKVIELLKHYPRYQDLPESPELQRIDAWISAGDDFCKLLQDGSALSLLAIREVRRRRAKPLREGERGRCFIFRSLKRPEEINKLQQTYSPAYFTIGAHAPRDTRRRKLQVKLARSDASFETAEFKKHSERLIETDEREHGKEFGQDIRSTFSQADVFIRAVKRREQDQFIYRSIASIFGYKFYTPTIDEYGMRLAFDAALRSSDLSRQVGAAILGAGGEVIALGTNDVPRAGGGQYWPHHEDDAREFRREENLSYVKRRQLFAETLKRLWRAGWLSEDKNARANSDLSELAREAVANPTLANARVMKLLEMNRGLHAEMSALLDAARRGISVDNATLYTTTFPCHLCAPHIVAAGIERVVFLEPYAKSLVAELFDDSIVVDPPEEVKDRVAFERFLGVAPTRYMDFFMQSEREGDELEGRKDKPARWKKNEAEPRFSSDHRTYSLEEIRVMDWLTRAENEGRKRKEGTFWRLFNEKFDPDSTNEEEGK